MIIDEKIILIISIIALLILLLIDLTKPQPFGVKNN